MVTFLADAAHLGFAVIGDVLVGHDHAAAIGLQEAHDVGKGDRFADAAAADDGHGLAGVDVEIGIDQNRAVERLIDVAEFDVVRVGITVHTEPIPRGC
jgi:hypothetical protein